MIYDASSNTIDAACVSAIAISCMTGCTAPLRTSTRHRLPVITPSVSSPAITYATAFIPSRSSSSAVSFAPSLSAYANVRKSAASPDTMSDPIKIFVYSFSPSVPLIIPERQFASPLRALSFKASPSTESAASIPGIPCAVCASVLPTGSVISASCRGLKNSPAITTSTPHSTNAEPITFLSLYCSTFLILHFSEGSPNVIGVSVYPFCRAAYFSRLSAYFFRMSSSALAITASSQDISISLTNKKYAAHTSGLNQWITATAQKSGLKI